MNDTTTTTRNRPAMPRPHADFCPVTRSLLEKYYPGTSVPSIQSLLEVLRAGCRVRVHSSGYGAEGRCVAHLRQAIQDDAEWIADFYFETHPEIIKTTRINVIHVICVQEPAPAPKPLKHSAYSIPEILGDPEKVKIPYTCKVKDDYGTILDVRVTHERNKLLRGVVEWVHPRDDRPIVHRPYSIGAPVQFTKKSIVKDKK